MGSTESKVCPRDRDARRAAHRLAAFEECGGSLERILLPGIHEGERGKSGWPPIAYTSEIALVAAMAPKSNGSSTIA